MSSRSRSINKNILRISRLIVLPRYRGLGLARRLIIDSLPITGSPMVEVIAAMSHHGTIFESAGFQRITSAPDTRRQNLQAAIISAGLGNNILWQPDTILNILPKLPPTARARIINASQSYISRFRLKHTTSPNDTVFAAVERLRTGGDYYWKTLKPFVSI